MTYRQALEVGRTHAADSIPAADMERVLGGSLHDLLQRHGQAEDRLRATRTPSRVGMIQASNVGSA